MSAVRRLEARSQARKTQSSPYARPQAQNSGWSLRGFLEPIRRRVFGEPEESEESIGRGRVIERSPSPLAAGLREQKSYGSIYTNRSAGSEPPRSPSKSVSPKRPPPREGVTPSATMENVLDWLTEATGRTLKGDDVHTVVELIHKGIPTEKTVTNSLSQSVGRSLGAIEVEGMVSLLRKQMPRAPSEPFRFKTSTPSREPTPTTTAPAPKKILTKNPNGAYRWQGAGSSKVGPRRNRYGSPAFGSSNVTPSKTKFAAGAGGKDTSVADGKRRRVESGDSSYFEPPATSSSQPALPADGGLPFPISSPSKPASNAATTSAPPTKITIPPAPVVAPPRLRTPTFKPSLPSQPSPLRHAWTGSPDSSVEDISVGSLSPPKSQPTQAASFMSGLIEKVTPAKKPDDLTNPYQTASPIAKVGPPRRSTRRTRPARAAIADVQEEKEEEEKIEEKKPTDLPPEAIFAATLPKGSKRSRPPANLEKSAPVAHRSPSPVTNGHSQDSQMRDYTVEEVDEDRTKKKQKGLNGLASPPSRTNDIVIEEVDEPEASTSQPLGNGSATNGFKPFGGFKPSAVPSRPSKLRFSYQAEVSAPSSPSSQPDTEPASRSSTMDLDAPPPPTLNSSFSFTPKPTPPAPAPAPAPTAPSFATTAKPTASADPKSFALSQNLKVFAFSIPASSIPTKHFAAAEKAKAQPVESLPTFDFSAQAGPSKASEASKPAATGFNWAAAGMKPAASTASQWTCGLCGLQSPDSAKDCTVCEAPRPAPKAEEAPTSTGFNWAAAGMKAPVAGASKWKCAVCDLENPEDVKDKCTVCDTPRPGAKADPPKSSGGFNWAAAGVNPPPPASGSEWTCSLCALKNPDSAAKCTICDTAR